VATTKAHKSLVSAKTPASYSNINVNFVVSLDKDRKGGLIRSKVDFCGTIVMVSVAEQHHFYAAPAPDKNFDAAPVAPAPTLLYSKTKFFKQTKV
jgi:hypothetical protein